ncbi:nuclear transport factor 2 family protein [Micromonospora sp. NPDC050397]|uniref:nuclear transport factor 2 family protein n=1 Tax=Micromonospora sp. NPDC050397 TaxID=3364279 RepID=UPI00384BA793
MSVPVPEVINKYFEATERRDAEAIAACFADDAVLTDDGQTHRGRAEIRRWRDEVATAFEYTTEILGVESGAPGPGDGGSGADTTAGYVVTARIEGNFPGNVVDLKYRFELRHELIQRLTIAV